MNSKENIRLLKWDPGKTIRCYNTPWYQYLRSPNSSRVQNACFRRRVKGWPVPSFQLLVVSPLLLLTLQQLLQEFTTRDEFSGQKELEHLKSCLFSFSPPSLLLQNVSMGITKTSPLPIHIASIPLNNHSCNPIKKPLSAKDQQLFQNSNKRPEQTKNSNTNNK